MGQEQMATMLGAAMGMMVASGAAALVLGLMATGVAALIGKARGGNVNFWKAGLFCSAIVSLLTLASGKPLGAVGPLVVLLLFSSQSRDYAKQHQAG